MYIVSAIVIENDYDNEESVVNDYWLAVPAETPDDAENRARDFFEADNANYMEANQHAIYAAFDLVKNGDYMRGLIEREDGIWIDKGW